MLPKQELRIILLHEFKLGRNVSEATRNVIKAWGEGAASERSTRRWFERFRSDGEANFENADEEELRALVEADRGGKPSNISRHLRQIGIIRKREKRKKNLSQEVTSSVICLIDQIY